MKKFLIAILALCLTLSCTFAIGACKDDAPPKDPSVQEPGGPGEDPGEDPGDKKPDDDDPGDQKPEPIDCGVFARKWVSYGYTLDLSACTLTGNGYEGFEVLSVEGEGADATISCKAGSKTYTLRLNAEGTLELKDGETTERTFLAAADPFAGAWVPDDDSFFTYFMISPDVGPDGTFAWDQYAFSGEAFESEGTATTVFSIGEEGAEVELKLLSYGYDFGTVTLTEGGRHFDDGYDYMVFDLLPYTDNVAEGSYLDETGNVFTYRDGAFTLGGESAAASAEAGGYGSGLSFTLGGKSYLYQSRPDGGYLLTDGVPAAVYPYDAEPLLGAWSDNSGNTLTFSNAESVEYNGVSYPLAPFVQYGEIVIGFSAGTTDYEIRFTENSAAIRLFRYGVGELFVRDDFKQEYVGNYTNKLYSLGIGGDYKMTNLTEEDDLFPAQADGSFAYLTEEDFDGVYMDAGTISYCFGDFALVCFPTEYCYPFYCCGMNGQSGLYEYQCVLYDEDELPMIGEMFGACLEGGDDRFTTGGETPDTLTIDFDGGTVTATGSHPASAERFFLDISEDNGLPALCYLTGEAGEEVFHFVEFAADGLYDTMLDLQNYEEIGECSYISEARYEKLLGMSFVYRGPYYDEVIEISESGVLSISTTDYTESDEAVVVQEYPYQLTRYSLLDGRETIGLAFGIGGEFSVLVNIFDLQYAAIMEVEYCRTELADFVGVYEVDGSTIELTVRATVLVDGVEAALSAPVSAENGRATATFTADGASYTVEFSSKSATLSGKTYTKNTETFPLEKFVGTYTVGLHEVTVKATAIGINLPLSLTATIDGTEAAYTVSVTENGQVLTLSALDFFTFETVEITLTLKDGTITLSDGTDSTTAEAADWNFAKFSSVGEFTLTDSEGAEHRLICLPKKGGTAPLFFYDDFGTMCTSYTVSRTADGAYSLTLEAGLETIEIVCAADGTLSAAYAGGLPPVPPPPPAPPAPPAP